MKISVITAVRDSALTVREAIESVQAQQHAEVEHLIIDGASTDGSLAVIEAVADEETRVVSEADDGLYHALNKGLTLATGDVLGVMHSDDVYADDQVLSSVASAFEDPAVDAVYGDLEYVARDDPGRVVRRWRAGEFDQVCLRRGWMPPHPTLFLRRSVIEEYGAYDTTYRISADYDAVLRYFSTPGFRARYVPRVLVRMRTGGLSNGSLRALVRKGREDRLALRRSGIGGAGTLLLKMSRKLPQFFAPRGGDAQ